MHVLDSIIVGLVVLASALYAFKSLAPRTYRTRFLAVLAGWAERSADGSRLRKLARRLLDRSATAKAGGCGGCGGCGSDDGQTPLQAAQPEVSVPLARIGRRRQRGNT